MSQKEVTERLAAQYCEWFKDFRSRYERMNELSTAGQIFYGTLFYTNAVLYLGVQKWRKYKMNYLEQ